MMKNPINFFLAISLWLLQFLKRNVGLLHLLQSKPYITNTGFIKSLISLLGLE